MLPDFAAVKHLLLAIRRQAVEVLQPLFILLPLLLRQMFELRIVLQCAPLLIDRLIAMLVKPLPKMMAIGRRAVGVLRRRRRTELRFWSL